MTTISVPNRFDDDLVLTFLPALHDARDAPDLHIDFAPLEYVLPFGTLLTCVALIDVMQYRAEKKLPNFTGTGMDRGGAVSYLSAFGFFRLLGLKQEQSVIAPGGNRYLPITKINKAILKQDANGRFQPAVEAESDKLARIVCGDDEGGAMMLSYCFREVIRNSFEHGEVSVCVAMAQRWYDGRVEIALADRGIGISTALGRVHKVESALDALLLAMRPGISSAGDRAKGDDWDNTGFGLYVISELGRQYGQVAIASSGALASISANAEMYGGANLSGTVVKLLVDTTDAEYWPNILANIVEQGEKIATATPGAIKTASKKSKGSA